jgi:MFS family permease
VCITGSLIACLGLLGASFACSIGFLQICYSLVTGIGFGCMYIPGVVASQEHFTRRRALATAIAVCGTGVGTLVLPPLVESFIEHHGWRWALRILSSICLGSVLCGASMFPAKRNNEGQLMKLVNSDEVVEKSECRGCRWLLSLIVGPGLASSDSLTLFLMVMLGDFLATMALCIPYVHLPDMAIARGVEPRNAAFLISSAGMCSTIGRVLAGLLCDQRKLHPMTITCVATAVAAAQAFLLSRYKYF